MYVSHVTVMHWYILVAVGILGSRGYELDPVLHLGHPGIHTVAGALTPIAHNANLRESKNLTYTGCS